MNERQLDLRAVLALLAVLIASTLFCGEKLQATIVDDTFGAFPAIVWLFATTFLAAMALCAAVAALGIGVTTIGQTPLPSWHALSRLAFDFSLWLFYWLGIWGGLSTISFILFLEARKVYPTALAGSLAVVVAAGSAIVTMKSIPPDVRRHMTHLNPYSRYGLIPGVLLFFFFTQFGHFVARSYYVFDLSIGTREVHAGAPLRVEARVSGHILNRRYLAARVEPLSSAQRSFPVPLESSGDGRYVGWVRTGVLSPGTYRVVLFFSNYASAAIAERAGLWYNANNQLAQAAIFRVIPLT